MSPVFDLVLGALLLVTFERLRPTDVPLHAIFAVLVVRAFAVDMWGTLVRLTAVVGALAAFVVVGSVGEDVDATDLAEWLLLIALVPLIAILAERREQSTRHFAALYDAAADRLVTSQEELRRDVAQDLHDGVGQGLGALMLTLDLLGTKVPGDDGALSLVERARRLAETVLSEVEGVASRLHATIAHENGLAVAIRQLAADAGIPVELSIDPDANVDRLAPAAQTALFRIVQEALANVARHSGATTARIAIACAGETVRVSIVDDGAGFVPSSARRRGIGLVGMEERAARVGGRVRVASRRELGTVVLLVLPWTEEGPTAGLSPRHAGPPRPVARPVARRGA